MHSWRWHVVGVLTALLLVLLIGFSRVYLVLHYLTDVLGGTFAGVVWLVLCAVGVSTLRRRARRQQAQRSA